MVKLFYSRQVVAVLYSHHGYARGWFIRAIEKYHTQTAKMVFDLISQPSFFVFTVNTLPWYVMNQQEDTASFPCYDTYVHYSGIITGSVYDCCDVSTAVAVVARPLAVPVVRASLSLLLYVHFSGVVLGSVYECCDMSTAVAVVARPLAVAVVRLN